MDHRPIKSELYEQFGRIGKAISSPKRLEILDLLAQAERTVEAIAVQTDLTVKNASAHLRVLRSARLVSTRKESPYVFYGLVDGAVIGLVRSLEEVARARLAEVQRLVGDYYEDPDELEAVAADELVRRLAEDDVILLDVRPVEEYRAGHIPGARSIPVGELKARLAELPADREVIAYCRGPYCLFSLEAVTELRQAGRRARRMEAGVPEWKASGRSVAVLDQDDPEARSIER
ncbi:MAG TPA: metalloregulator ArsR/SmtB family transcription factor [Longimicrobiales bacterium]|nr:metalloregulator ArsR/SmtB family transcription factor [Longimicrobiales bacterium]